ncbi:hypothetical protein G3N57_17825, partial [Paraburkholderia sp. Se-20369]|nr:hypothetical protein [Paraburkholderia sp. Se-20369]
MSMVSSSFPGARACVRRAALAALAVQYPDYVAWQRQWLGAERLERESGYWRKTLVGIPTLL